MALPPLPTDPPMASGDVCDDSSDDGWLCTADDGHPNYHIAHDLSEAVHARWPYRDDAP